VTQPASTNTPAPTSTSVPQTAINPFTGLPISITAASRIPLLVKVSNSPEVRPQTGLALADVVVEHYAEGGITRFSALFLTHSPDKVGSVRSCRLIDLELVVIFGSGMVCSGTSGGVRQRMVQSPSWEGANRVVTKTVWMVSDQGAFECQRQAGCTLPMFRTSDQVPPHNLFANTVNARKELDKRNKNIPSVFKTWTFDERVGGAGEPARQITIPYTSGAVTWVYDPSAGVWARSIGRRPHIEKLTNKQLTAANVIVVFANHVFTPIIEDRGGSRSIEVQLWGDGPVKVFRDGKMIEGTWRRTGGQVGWLFVDASGAPIALKPGNTWLQMVPLNFAVKAL
jgi:hypothetical protein